MKDSDAWVKIRGQANKGNLIVGVYYRPPAQGEDVDEAFLLQLPEASHSQVKSKVKTLNFRRVRFQVFKEQVDGTPWETVLRDKGAEGSWQLFKAVFL